MGIQPIFSAGNISILTAGVNLRHFTNRPLAPSQILESQYQLLRTVHSKLRNIFLKFPKTLIFCNDKYQQIQTSKISNLE